MATEATGGHHATRGAKAAAAGEGRASLPTTVRGEDFKGECWVGSLVNAIIEPSVEDA